MILRTTLMVGVLSQFLLAADFAPPTLFPDQNTGSLHDLNRQTLDRQIQAALSGKQPKIKNHPSLPLLGTTKLKSNQPLQIASSSVCAIPLTRMKVDNPKRFRMKFVPVPPQKFDSMAQTAPMTVCKE